MWDKLLDTGWNAYLPSLLFIVWAFLHSLFADPSIKQKIRFSTGDKAYRWYRLLYVLISLVTFCGILWLSHRHPGSFVWNIKNAMYWVLNGIRLTALILFVWAGSALNMRVFLGFNALGSKDRYADSPNPELSTGGAYGIVRHPLYSLGLVLLWANPTMTTGNLTFAAAASLYLWLGSVHEEISLRKEFGDAYVEYSKRVPRLIPNLFRRKPE